MELQTFISVSFIFFNYVLGNPENLLGSSASSARQTETILDILPQNFLSSEGMQVNDQHANDFTHNFSTDQPTSSSQTIQEVSTTESGCPKMDPDYNSRVYKGEDVDPPNRYPWVVKIMTWKYNMSYSCTGSIIDSSYVLTAAHCLVYGDNSSQANVHPKNVHVVVGNGAAGTENRNESNQKLKTIYSVRDLFVHEGYVSNKTLVGNDIAILLLSEPLGLLCREDVSSIRLPSSSPNCGDGIVAGWGAMTPEDEMPTKLQEGSVRVNDICFPYYPFSFDEPNPRVVCLYGIFQHSFVCEGDSGGPVMQLRNNLWEVVGIVSSGINFRGKENMCSSKLGISIATNVYYYKDWINQIVQYLNLPVG